MDMTLVVMAAGLGSRYGGVKQIERLGPDGEILMEYAIYDALRAGFDRIVLIIKPSMLEDVRAHSTACTVPSGFLRCASSGRAAVKRSGVWNA